MVSEHDTVDLPAVRPVVERHRRLAVCCPSCGKRVVAAMPPAAIGTPFGERIHAMATYLKTFQAVSYERLQRMLADLFGLTISQGGLMNMLRRAQEHFVAGREVVVASLRRARVVSSDETGVRIEGANAYHWVFRCDSAVVHTASPTRGAIVVREMMHGHRPDVWCSDRYAAQQGHAEAHQTCLAHLARDVAFAVQNSEDLLPTRLKLWLDKAFCLARDVGKYAPATIARRRRELERFLDDIIATPTACVLAAKVRDKLGRARDQLLTFARWTGQVQPTNNACERDLRPAVIQRKVTNGYRAMWAAKGEADIRTVVATARLTPGTNTFQTIAATLGARLSRAHREVGNYCLRALWEVVDPIDRHLLQCEVREAA